jgi:hypothetical protein
MLFICPPKQMFHVYIELIIEKNPLLRRNLLPETYYQIFRTVIFFKNIGLILQNLFSLKNDDFF